MRQSEMAHSSNTLHILWYLPWISLHSHCFMCLLIDFYVHLRGLCNFLYEITLICAWVTYSYWAYESIVCFILVLKFLQTPLLYEHPVMHSVILCNVLLLVDWWRFYWRSRRSEEVTLLPIWGGKLKPTLHPQLRYKLLSKVTRFRHIQINIR
jgi:hypothetical protein